MLNRDDLQRKQFKRSELQRVEIMYTTPVVDEPVEVRKKIIVSCDILSESINKILTSSGEAKATMINLAIKAGIGVNSTTARSALYNLRSVLQGYKDFLIRYSLGKREIGVVAYLPVVDGGKESERFIYSIVEFDGHRSIIKSKKKYFKKHPAEILAGKSEAVQPLDVPGFFELLQEPKYKALLGQSTIFFNERNKQFSTKTAEREHNHNVKIVKKMARNGEVEIIEDLSDLA